MDRIHHNIKKVEEGKYFFIKNKLKVKVNVIYVKGFQPGVFVPLGLRGQVSNAVVLNLFKAATPLNFEFWYATHKTF
jgi:hypothetical protein